MVIAPVVAVPVVNSRSIVTPGAIIQFIGAHREHGYVDSCAFVVHKFAFLILFIARNDSQSFVAGNSRIASHGLIVYEHSPIHATATDQISYQVGNIGLAVPPAVLRPHDPPAAAFVLRASVGAEQRCAHPEQRQHNCSVK
jgi:hypothetical protein